MNKSTKQPIKMIPGDDTHLTMLMAPSNLNFFVGKDREDLLAYGRAAFEAGKVGQCLHQIQEPSAAEQAAWHAGLDEGRAQAAQPSSVSNAETPQAAPAAVAVADERDSVLRDLTEHASQVDDHTPQSFASGVKKLAARARAALAATPAADAKPFLSEDDLDDLRRFEGMASDGESYDIAKKRMKRLAELGVVRWVGGSRYCMTAFGQYVLKCWDRLPLETHEEANARANAELRARMGRLNSEAIAAQAAQGGE